MGIISTRRFEQNGSDGSEWAVSSGGEHYLDTVGATSSNLVSPTICGHGSVGRAQPCQGWGRGFEPRCPLQNSQPRLCGVFSFIGPGIVRVEESLKKLQISKALFLLAFVGSQKGSSVEMQFNRTKFSPAFERKREVVGQKRRPRGAFSFPDKLLLHPNANVLGGFRQA